MWDNPRALNIAAAILYVLAVCIASLVIARMLWLSPLFPVREVTVIGQHAHADREALETAVDGRVNGNFFSAEMDEIRAGMEALPWVRRASVRRIWPDRVEVRLEEHVAFARWGDLGLVNIYGERFPGTTDQRLPMFAGPAGSEAEVTRQFRRFSHMLQPLNATLERLVLTPRFSWQLRLSNGLNIELGRDLANDTAEARLHRFVAAYPLTLGRIARQHQYVDLRYPNGFALRIPVQEQTDAQKGKG